MIKIKEELKSAYLVMRGRLLAPLLLARPIRAFQPGSIHDIIFFRHDRVGDMALCLPVFRLLKTLSPHVRLTVLSSRSNRALLDNNPYIDEVIVYNGICDYLRQLQNRHFDLAVDPFHNNHEMTPALMTLLSGARYRLGFALAGREIFFSMHTPRYDENKSFMELMMLLLSELGIADDNSDEKLIFVTKEEIIEAKRRVAPLGGRRLTAIHPGAFYPSQRWPLDRFTDVAHDLTSHGFGVLFFAQAHEFPDFDETVFRDNPNILVIRDSTLRQFIALVSICEKMVCNNSGPLHIAAALKVRTVSTMGPTVPAVWRPQGRGHTVIRRGYSCSPCNKDVCPTHECMMDIKVSDVLESIYNN